MKNKRFFISIKEKYLLIAPSAAILVFSLAVSANIFDINGNYQADTLLWLYSRTFSLLFTIFLGIRNVVKGVRKNNSHYLKLGTFAVVTYMLTFSSTFAVHSLLSIKLETFITAFKVMSACLLVLGNTLFLIYLRKR